MSDPTRTAREELEATLALEHRAAAPAEPGDAALDRVRVRAERQAGSAASREAARGWRRPIVWRTALVAAVVVGILGVSFAVIRPGQDSAFARDKLLNALAPSGSVLHYIERVSSTHDSGQGSTSSAGTFEHWVDATNERSRTEMGPGDGSPTRIEIESDGRILGMGPVSAWPGDPRFPEPSAEATAAEPWYALETPNDEAYSGNPDGFNPFFELDLLREAVANGQADAVGSVDVDGTECWEIEWRVGQDSEPLGPEGVYTAVVRKNDYRPVRSSIAVYYDGVEQERFESEITLWEELPAGSIDPALFERWEFTQPVTYEQRVYSPHDLADFPAFDAWWLGPEFEGRVINGMVAIPLELGAPDGAESFGTLPEITYARGQGAAIAWLPFAEQGELSMTYSEGGVSETRPSDVRVIVMTQQTEQDIETHLRSMPSSVTPGSTVTAATFAWREAGGRRYFERVETWSTSSDDRPSASSLIGAREGANSEPTEDESLPQAGTTSTAILNLGNTTVHVTTPDSETTARAVAALMKAN